MEKVKQYKYLIIVVLIVFVGAFYWISIRPVQVKKNCAWTKEVIPADEGVTKEQAEINKKLFSEKCDVTKTYQGYQGLSTVKEYTGRIQCQKLYEDSFGRPSLPEKTEVREATKNEYDMCLRQHGL